MKRYPRNLQAVLVDFDGTFVDSVVALRECFNEFLAKYSVVGTDEEYLSLVGPSLYEIVEKLKISHSLPGSIEALYYEYCELILKTYELKISIYPNALAVLNRAKERGLKLALVTSASLHLIENFLARYQLQVFFDALITGVKNEPSKPSPALYQRALKTLGIPAQEAIAIEDSRNGILSAHAAGIYVIQFGSPSLKEGASLSASCWEEVEEGLYGYQTFKIFPSFVLKVEESRDKFMLSDIDKAHVELLWEKAQSKHQGTLFNGQLLSFSRFENENMVGEFVEYKWYVAQLADPDLEAQLQICPIAISCFCTLKDDVLLGIRSSLVTSFPDCFELAPSGGIDPTAAANGKINLTRQALKELKEEANIDSSYVKECDPVVIIKDLITGYYEVCMHIALLELSQLCDLRPNTAEYSHLEWISKNQLKELAANQKEQFVPFSLHLIRNL